MTSLKTVLVLAPHPDDGEFGCGASVHKLTQAGVEVHYAAFSPCTISVPNDFEQDILYKELHLLFNLFQKAIYTLLIFLLAISKNIGNLF